MDPDVADKVYVQHHTENLCNGTQQKSPKTRSGLSFEQSIIYRYTTFGIAFEFGCRRLAFFSVSQAEVL